MDDIEKTQTDAPGSSDSPNEKTPIHRRQAKIYIFAVIGILILALFFDTFSRFGGEKENKETSTPIAQTQPMDPADFQTRFSQEVERRKTAKEQVLPSETPKETMARLENQRKEQGKPPQDPNPAPVDIYREFKDAEQRRALNARKSGFKMRRSDPSMASLNTNQMNIVPPSPGAFSIEKEKARVITEIERLKNQQTGGSGSSLKMSGFVQKALHTEPGHDPADEWTAGRPRSESEPKKGQKLISTATIINGVLDQTVMSDYTGSYRGLITHDVYDVTARSIVIPKGSRFIGKCLRISNVNEPIQARMGLTVNWVILPNGRRISFEKKADMLDQAGIHAVKDKVNYHFVAQFLGVAAYALLSSETNREGSGTANDTTFKGDVGEAMREQFAPLAAKYLDLVPTITLRSGEPIKIFLEDDVYADEWEPVRARLIKANRSSY